MTPLSALEAAAAAAAAAADKTRRSRTNNSSRPAWKAGRQAGSQADVEIEKTAAIQ